MKIGAGYHKITSSLLAISLMTASVSQASWLGRVFDSEGSGHTKEEVEKAKAKTPKPVSYPVEAFKESDFTDKPWMKDFRYVIVINKAQKGKTAQRIRVYENGYALNLGKDSQGNDASKVSTGRETFEMESAWIWNHGPDNGSYWSITPTGYYTPEWLNKDHRSSSWDTDMPYAVFFDTKNGIAMHEVPPKGFLGLGTRRSGGCIRLHPETAQNLFERIEKTRGSAVPVIGRDGKPELDSNGKVVYRNYGFLNGQKIGAYSALIIVQDIQD
ncbi:MAG: L,D-transpeptidase [Pseudobdellovibrionaceae bacterium]